MLIDWQTILVILVVATASIYIARRLLKQVKSLASKSGDDSCASGCGSCGSPIAKKQPGIVQITRKTVTTTSSFVKR